MSAEGDGSNDIAGLQVEEAAEVVEDAERDREAVQRLLGRVAEDGVVSRAAAEDALAHCSKVVSTPETRVEVAADALDDAQDAAGPYDGLATVRARLDAFDERLADVRRRADDLGPRLQGVVERIDDAPLYDVAVDVHELSRDANAVQQAADELLMDVEAFERWVGSPSTRYDELRAELDGIDDSLDELADALDAVEERAGESGSSPPADDDPAVAWADVALQRRLMDLLLSDVRAELSDLRSMADRADADGPPRALGEQLAALESDTQAVADRIEAVARPGWVDRFDTRLTAFDEDLATFDPPVDWGAVGATLEDYRERLATRQ